MNTIPTYDKIHLRFKLNNKYYDREGLLEVAYSYIKEGEAYQREIGHFLMDWLDYNSYVLVNTSGSTGTPKQIKIQKQAMVHSALASGDFFDIKIGDTALLCLPAAYIAGKMMLVRAMVLGLEIDLVAPTSTPLKEIKKSYDFVAMIPLQVQHSLEQLDQLKTVIVGGAAVDPSLAVKLQATKATIYETYAMTETVTHIAAKKVNGFTDETAAIQACFEVLPHVKISTDERGCLRIDAPHLSETVVQTNDLVELVSDSSFIWKGRVDNVINSAGVKLIPELIEKKLSSVITSRYFVYGLPDTTLGQKLILVVEDKENPALSNTLKQLDSLDKFEHPKEIFFVDRFVETANNKVQRQRTVERIVGVDMGA